MLNDNNFRNNIKQNCDFVTIFKTSIHYFNLKKEGYQVISDRFNTYIHTYLAQTPEIGQGLGRFLSCGARKQVQTYTTLFQDKLILP